MPARSSAGSAPSFSASPPSTSSVDLNGVVETVRTLLGPELARRRVTLELDLATALPPVLGDAVQLQQVLVNLLINGTDAMESVPPGRRQLRVRTASGTRHDSRVRLDVTDAGPGLDPEAKKRLFEPFFTTKPNGLGMGLAICRSIVEAHGGRIQPRAGRAGDHHPGLPPRPTGLAPRRHLFDRPADNVPRAGRPLRCRYFAGAGALGLPFVGAFGPAG